MNARRVEVTFSVAEWDLLNKNRGLASRAAFVKHHYLRALESALGGVEESKPEPLDHSVSAPSRAPVVEPDAFAAGEVMDRPRLTGRDLEIPGATAAHHALMMDRQAKLNKRGKK